MLGGLADPHRPERRATAAALATTAEVIALGEAVTPRHWHRAHTAINRASAFIQAAPPVPRRQLHSLLHWAEALLTDAVLAPGHAGIAARVPALRQEASALRRTTLRLRDSRGTDRFDDERSSSTALPPEVVALQRRNARHAAVLRLLTAGRVLLGAGVAGAVALMLHIGHPYWAPVSAVAVLQATHVQMTWHRSIQRGLGTAGGLLLVALLLMAHPAPLMIAALVVLMQLGIEVFLSRNYALGVLFITPVTMLLSDLLRPSSTYELVTDRSAGVALGILIGLSAALVVAHPHATVTLRDAMERCRAAMVWAGSDHAGKGLAATEELRDALVALRTAEDTARGETWPTGVSRAAVAEIENRAYRVLATHRQALRADQPLP
nr:FUSC family protein [Planosporangium flavigriseum]